mgnify:CR=1 FL=1
MTTIAERLSQINDYDDFNNHIRYYLQSNNIGELSAFMMAVIPVLNNYPESFDLTDYFHYCRQDGWYASCYTMALIVSSTPYYLNISDNEQQELIANYTRQLMQVTHVTNQ